MNNHFRYTMMPDSNPETNSNSNPSNNDSIMRSVGDAMVSLANTTATTTNNNNNNNTTTQQQRLKNENPSTSPHNLHPCQKRRRPSGAGGGLEESTQDRMKFSRMSDNGATTVADEQSSIAGEEEEPDEEVVEGQEEEEQEEEEEDAPPWTSDMHRAFVEAMFQVGIRQASPSVILELMQNETNQPLTTERVKSRLQKYRNNFSRSRKEFLTEYDSWITKALTVGRSVAAGGGSSSNSNSNFAEPSAVVEMMGLDQLLGGDVAAYLTYSCMAEDSKASNHNDNNISTGMEDSERSPPPGDGQAASIGVDHPFARMMALGGRGVGGDDAAATQQQLWNGSQDFAKYFTGTSVKLPKLTEAERASPLGASLTNVVSLFYSMTQHIMQQRNSKEKVSAEEQPEEEKIQTESYQQQQPVSRGIHHAEQRKSPPPSKCGPEEAEETQEPGVKQQQTAPFDHKESNMRQQHCVGQHSNDHSSRVQLPQQEHAAHALYAMADLATGSVAMSRPVQQQQQQHQQEQQQRDMVRVMATASAATPRTPSASPPPPTPQYHHPHSFLMPPQGITTTSATTTHQENNNVVSLRHPPSRLEELHFWRHHQSLGLHPSLMQPLQQQQHQIPGSESAMAYATGAASLPSQQSALTTNATHRPQQQQQQQHAIHFNTQNPFAVAAAAASPPPQGYSLPPGATATVVGGTPSSTTAAFAMPPPTSFPPPPFGTVSTTQTAPTPGQPYIVYVPVPENSMLTRQS